MARVGCRKSVAWRTLASTPSPFLNMSRRAGNCRHWPPWHSSPRVLHDYEFSRSCCKTPFIIRRYLRKTFRRLMFCRHGRIELGIRAGWQRDDYIALGLTFENASTRIAKLAESLDIIRQYFSSESVDFTGDQYRINHMEALPRCVQRPNPPILVGAGGPRMLELAGRKADIVGIHPRMGTVIDRAAVADLTSASIKAKIELVRAAAAAAGRPTPQLQFSCYQVRVTDHAPEGSSQRSSWAAHVEAEADSLKGSPAILVGTAADCAEKLIEWRERFGITYWHLGPNVDAVALIIDQLGGRH